MSGQLLLNGTWKLSWAEGDGLMAHRHLTAAKLGTRPALDARVPAPIHQVLSDAGLIDDVNVGLNSLRARWVEEMFWVFRHSFSVPAEVTQAASVRLCFACLELDVEVFLNNESIGVHRNAHRPAEFDVAGKLKVGENLLVVCLESGMHSNSDRQGTNYGTGDIGRLTKRHWNRHPQYQHGWDWQARLVNIGILGDVELQWNDGPRMDEVTVFSVPADDLCSARFTLRATVHGEKAIRSQARLRVTLRETGQEVETQLTLTAGDAQRCELVIDVKNPQLWWPVGYGNQPLYHVQAELISEGEAVQRVVRRTGVRRVEMDQSPHHEKGRHCILKINHTKVFCKGGNWVPPAMLYGNASPEHFRRLAAIALDANFNLLRIWGGGTFADPALCDFCDENGILIWHDFLFACAKYPMHDPAFLNEARREVTFATRRMAHHPALVVWCGNNEIESADWNWGYDNVSPATPHYAFFHRDIPVILKREDPSTLHWISSPISPDYENPDDAFSGDQHPWMVSIGAPGGADFHRYRQQPDRFANEGGLLGASSPATLKQFLPENERHLLSPSWDHHDNTLAAQDSIPGEPGHAYQTVTLWTGLEPSQMNWEDYAFVSALLQAEGLVEYISNYRRRKYSSAAAVFWMFNDSWPTTHGWTIVDYYLRRKLAYCPVKRAFAPVTVVVAEEDNQINIYGVNETLQEKNVSLRYGLVATLTPEWLMTETLTVCLAPNASTLLATFSKERMVACGTDRCVAAAVLLDGETEVARHRLMLERFKAMKFATPQITIEQGVDRITLNTDIFAWGVCLDVDGELPLADNCIDLLPGISYPIAWTSSCGTPRVVRIGNCDASTAYAAEPVKKKQIR